MRFAALSLVCLVLFGGCVTDVSFDPRPEEAGDGVSLTTSWTVFGRDASYSRCRTAGIVAARLSFREPSGTDEYTSDALTFPCGVCRSEIDDAIAKNTSARYRWDGLDVDGLVVSLGRVRTFAGADLDQTLGSEDFSASTFDPQTAGTVSLSGSWNLNGQEASTTSCDGSGVAEVRLVLVRQSDQSEYRSPELTFPCDDASFTMANAIRTGIYDYYWEAVDADDVVIDRFPLLGATTEEFTLDLVDAQSLALSKAEFSISLQPQEGFELNVMWEGAAGFETCSLDLNRWSYTFADPGEQSVAEFCRNADQAAVNVLSDDTPLLDATSVDVNCACDSLTECCLPARVEQAAGNHTVRVCGYLASGAVGWASECSATAGAVFDAVTCEVSQVAGQVLELSWEDATSSDDAVQALPCEELSDEVTDMTLEWSATEVGGTTTLSGKVLGCVNTLPLVLPSAGNYNVTVSASDDCNTWMVGNCSVSGTRNASASCSMFLQ